MTRAHDDPCARPPRNGRAVLARAIAVAGGGVPLSRALMRAGLATARGHDCGQGQRPDGARHDSPRHRVGSEGFYVDLRRNRRLDAPTSPRVPGRRAQERMRRKAWRDG